MASLKSEERAQFCDKEKKGVRSKRKREHMQQKVNWNMENGNTPGSEYRAVAYSAEIRRRVLVQ